MYQYRHIPQTDVVPGKDFPILGDINALAGVNPQEFSQLRGLIWDRADATFLTLKEAFSYYESLWRFVDVEDMDLKEKNLLEYLIATEGNGVFLG